MSHIWTSFQALANRFDFFSIAIDESTDAKDTSQLAVFVRGVSPEFEITEEFLELVPMKGTTTGKDVADAVIDCHGRNGMDLKKLIAVTTDGAPVMVGEAKGTATLIARRCTDEGSSHVVKKLQCIIHQEALCAKAASLPEVMAVIVKCVNSILA